MSKLIKVKTITLLILAMVMGKSSLLAQQLSWEKMEDIREVTGMASCRGWETIKEDKGVTLRSRWLLFGDSLKTREISSYFIVKSDVQSVLANLQSPEKMLEWNEGLRSMKLLKQDGSIWITHTIYDIPYPFSQQDLVVKNVMVKDKQKVTILLSSLPDYIDPINDINRQRFYFGKWELNPLNSETTEVRFSALSFSSSRIPRLIRDPIIQSKLFHSFLKLKEQSTLEVKRSTK